MFLQLYPKYMHTYLTLLSQNQIAFSILHTDKKLESSIPLEETIGPI